MEGFLLFVLVVVLIVRWAMLSRRYSEMEQRIAMVIREHIDPKEITRLIKRITQLEETVAELKRGRPVEAVEAAAAPVAVPEPAPQPVAIPVVAPAPRSEAPQPLAPPAPPRPVAPPV